VIVARIQLRHPEDIPDPAETEEQVRELDRQLDQCLPLEAVPAPRRPRRARRERAA
jgi:hypothetical protein